jgi:acetylornithine deacetylase
VHDANVWTHEPFAADRVDGRLYGFGVADDMAGVAGAMAALRVVQQLNLTLRGDVVIGSCASKRHAQGIVAGFDNGYRTDGSVYLHPAESGRGLIDIKGATSGILIFRIAVSGREPETSEPNQIPFEHLGSNAIDSALLIVQALRAAERDLAGQWRDAALEEAMGGMAVRLSLDGIQSTSVEGRIPIRCEVQGTLIFPPAVSLTTAQRAVEATLVRVRGDLDVSSAPTVRWLYGAEGAEISERHDLFQIASSAIEAATGRRPRMYRLHVNSDIRVPFNVCGTPCIGFGPRAGNSAQIGQHDEWLEEDEFVQMIHAVVLIVLGWCGYVSPAAGL